MELEPEQFSATLVHLDGNAVFVLLGELDISTAPDFATTLDPLVQSGPSEVVLEMSGLAFIDSSGIAALVSVQNRLEQQGRRLILRSPRRNALRVFEISGLTDFLNVETEPSSTHDQ